MGTEPGGGKRWLAGRAQRGLSYMEVLLALVILTVGLVGGLGAVSTAALDIYAGGRESVATGQAQAILERIRNAASYEDLLSYADVALAGATTPRPLYVTQNRAAWLAALQADPLGGQGRITIGQQGVAPNRLALVTITIDWPGRTGPNPLTVATQIGEWP